MERKEHNDAEAQASYPISSFRLAHRNFASQWFLIPQGTGILAVILHQLDYQFRGLAIISEILWVLTIVELVVMLIVYIARALLYPDHVRKQLNSSIMETACLSSISIAFTTIIQMIVLNLVGDWGKGWGFAAFVLWWINVALSTAACIGLPYVFTKLEAPGVDNVPAGILLPLIAALTTAAGGGVVCRYGALDAGKQVPVIIVSYLSIGLALPLAVVCDAIILARLFNKSWPPKEQVYTLMLLCGPLGQGSFAMQILGDCVGRGAFANYGTSSFLDAAGGSTVATSSQFLGLLTWGYGTFWWAFALISVLEYVITDPRGLLKWDRNLAAWPLVFPWGVYTNAAVELGVVLDSPAFNVWSTVLALMLVLLWLANMGSTLLGIFKGAVFGLERGWRATYSLESAEDDSDHGKYNDAEKEKER